VTVSAGLPQGPAVPDWDPPASVIDRLEALEDGKVDVVGGTVDAPTTHLGRAFEVYTDNPLSGRKERFSVENNQDTDEVDINFRNCTVNFGDPSAAVSTDGSAIFMQPAGGSSNPINVKETGEGSSGVSVFLVGPHGTIVSQTYGFATYAFTAGAFNEAQPRLAITPDGQIWRGPGGSTAPAVGTLFGTGSPEGVITAGVGSTFQRRDGGAGTCFYVKESGVGNTGWVAK
jgi:hypothetical protein